MLIVLRDTTITANDLMTERPVVLPTDPVRTVVVTETQWGRESKDRYWFKGYISNDPSNSLWEGVLFVSHKVLAMAPEKERVNFFDATGIPKNNHQDRTSLNAAIESMVSQYCKG